METTQTVSMFDIARERVGFELALITAIEAESARFDDPIDDFNMFSVGLWTYQEPFDIQELSDGARRAEALIWLRRHTLLINRVAHRMGHFEGATKFATEWYFGARLRIQRSSVVGLDLIAQVPSGLTCEMVPTGEVDHIPARDVPVMERRCPESIFRGIESEVAV